MQHMLITCDGENAFIDLINENTQHTEHTHKYNDDNNKMILI